MFERDNLKSALAPTAECLTPQQMELLLDGKQSNSHLGSCPRCQAELAMLRSFESDSPIPGEGAAVTWISSRLEGKLETIKAPSRGRFAGAARRGLAARGTWFKQLFGRGNMRWALAGAAVVTVAIFSTVFLRTEKEPQLQARVESRDTIYRSQDVQIVAPIGQTEQVPAELRWQPFAGSALYRVSLMEVDREALWTGEARDTFIAIPASVRAKLLPGKPILWQVASLDAKGHTLATSQVQRFEVSERHSPKR